MITINTKVRQPRVHTLDNGDHDNFGQYLSDNNYNESDRAYALDVGHGLIESVGEDGKFSKLSFPYPKSQTGYAVVVFPSNQIMSSGNRTLFGNTMVDIDLGDKTKKYTAKYVGSDGSTREEFVATRMIERYLNFTASAYEVGLYYGDGKLPKIVADLDSPYSFSSTTHTNILVERLTDSIPNERDRKSVVSALKHPFDMNNRDYIAFKQYFDENFVRNGVCDYDKWNSEMENQLADIFTKDDVNDIYPITRHVSLSNTPLYNRSVAAGMNDRVRLGSMCACYVLYPPEKDSAEYNKFKDMGFDNDVFAVFNKAHDEYVRRSENSDSPSGRRSGYVYSENVIDFDDDDLPFI